MTATKKVIPVLDCRAGMLQIPGQDGVYQSEEILSICHYYSDHGADALLIRDLSATDAEHEKNIYLIKNISREIDIPIITGGNVRNLEDVKKYLYAGAQSVYLDAANDDNVDLMKEAADRFGTEKIFAALTKPEHLNRVLELLQLGAGAIIADIAGLDLQQIAELASEVGQFYLYSPNELDQITTILNHTWAAGVMLSIPVQKEADVTVLKHQLKTRGVAVETYESRLCWADFKLNSDGQIPVIVQDYKTAEILMLAYMNQEAFEKTVETGIMTYFSRSRQSLWVKGETSGHTQYVKELTADCDRDTLLAKVRQLGPACHTGAKSCFFETLVKKEYQDVNPLKVFEDVYATIKNRKEFPKEGSYTNYLFDKGIDKILKKLGEEATEIVIASKNPNTEEIKYEISDFLYHMMVLMAEKNITWEEITKELSDRS